MKIKLKKILNDRKISPYRIGTDINVAPNNIAKIIRGETTSISFDILEKICQYLNITPNDIFEIEYTNIEKEILELEEKIEKKKKLLDSLKKEI